MSFSVFRCL